MNSFINAIQDETTKTYTENGSLTYSTTLSANVDLFFLGSALRGQNKERIQEMFSKAYAENPDIALANMWYIRDIRGGQGERQQARNILEFIGKNHKDLITEAFLYKLAEYGRYDDILTLLYTNTEVVIEFIRKELSNNNTLLAKWLPSENASSKKTKELAIKIRNELKITSQEYRKILSQLRREQHLVETSLTNKDYESINYEHVPSQAGLKYRKAFKNRDGERYESYLESVKNGIKKINTGTLTPVDIVNKYIHFGYSFYRPDDDNVLNTIWDNLPNYFGDDSENSIVVCDTSGSMFNGCASVPPITVAISLAIYIAERNKGTFKDTFITFSERPQLNEIRGKTLFDKIYNISQANWGMNTNLDKVFETILNACKLHNVPAEECPKRIYIISDMEFDGSVRSNDTTMNHIREMYKSYGYEVPQVIFWNVNSRQNNCPVRFNENGVGLISGYSPVILKYILNKEEITPEKIMMETLTRYID